MDEQLRRGYASRGYLIERAVFDRAEVERITAHYVRMREAGPHPGDFAGVPTKQGADDEPLARFPRLIDMHRWDPRTSDWANDVRLLGTVGELMREPAELLQTMVYFKPPGSRGQSFHQDNLYLRITPVVAAWVALDACDAENGAMEMVRGSHLLGLLPCQFADTDVSFTDSETVVPAFLPRDLIALNPGDVVYFHGLTIHGSAPNRAKDRFRRAFICHYKGRASWPIVAPPLPVREAK
jgi:ectoine hydroxylase-related dioxygenase (phytanoyl-CoA dioxygenase family)